MPGRFSVRFFAVRRLPAVGIPVLKRAGPMVSPVFFVCAGGAPGPVRCDDVASPPLFFCRPVLPPRPAAPSCRPVLPLRPAAPSCRSVLPLRPAAPSCRPVLPPCSAPRPAALSCCPSYCPVLPSRPAAPPSGFGRIRPDGACRFLALPSVRGKSACGETPFLHDLTRAATKNDPVEGRFHRVASPLSRRYRRIRRPAPPRARPVRGLRRAPSCIPSRSALSL